jgi:glyoxylase-like metal-dependent hydrolase (beta-lactamase superfamily II)
MGKQPGVKKVTRALGDGETLTLGDRTVRVFAVPGHTAGSAAYLVDGALFLGDSAGATSDGKIKGAPFFFSDSTSQNHASLRALAERLRPVEGEVKVLVPAHTGTLAGLGPLLAFVP